MADVVGAMVAQKIVQLRDGLGNIRVADFIDDVKALAGVQVVQVQNIFFRQNRLIQQTW